MARDFSAELFGTPQQDLGKDFSSELFGTVPEKSGFFRQAADVPVGIAKGVTSGVRMLTDVFGADNPVSQALQGTEGYLNSLMSAQARNDQQEIARIMKEAEDKGVLDQVIAGVKAFATAPVDMLSQAAGTAVPVIAGGLAGTIAKIAPRALSAGIGAAMGTGTVKGTIYEETKKALVDAGVPEAQAESRAQLAQSYGGNNLDQILMGTALGGLTAITGFEAPAAQAIARRILGKEAAEKSAETVAKEAGKSLARKAVETGATEAAPEFLQAYQEKVASNIAQQREGLDVDALRGAVAAGTLEGLAGFGLGAGVGAITRPGVTKPETPEEPKEPPKLIGYDPKTQEPMYVFPDGSVATGEEAAFAKRYEPVTEEPKAEPPKLLGYSPTAGQEPLYVFSDGSVAVGEDAAFNRRYEPQKLSQEELSSIIPDLEGVEFKPIDQEALPLTKEEEEYTKTREAEIASLSKRAQRIGEVTKENSLYNFFRENKLNPKEVNDISPDKTFNFLRKKGGADVSDFVGTGDLNEWLPFEYRMDGNELPEVALEKEIAATEYIKDALRNQDFLPYDTKLELEQLGYTIQSLQQEIEKEVELDNLRDILAEIAEEESARYIESPFPEGAEAGVTEPTGQIRIEGEARKAVNPEERAIADRERDMFALQPQTPERIQSIAQDLFGAEGISQVKPKAPAGKVTPKDQLTLFGGEQTTVKNKAEKAEAPANIEEAKAVEKAIQGKSAIDVAKFIADTAPDADRRLIARRIVDRMQKLMDAGVKFNFKVTHVGDVVPTRLLRANGLTVSSVDEQNLKLNSVDIYVNGTDVTGRIGTDYEIVLHELLHSVTQAGLYLGRTKEKFRGTNFANLSDKLIDVSNAVIAHYNQKVRDFKAGKGTLTDFENEIYNGANALKSPDEVLAWAMTSREMQDYLEAIPYKNTTVWDTFVNAIRQFLGLSKANETALSEVIGIAGKLLEAPLEEVGVTAPVAPEVIAKSMEPEQLRLFNESIAKMRPADALKSLAAKKKAPEENLTKDGEDAKKILDRLGSISNPKPKAADETLVKRLQAKFTPTDNISWETRFRRAVVDKDAPVIEQLQTKFNNELKDALGGVRADLNLMQGQDVSNFSDLMAQKGGIQIGKDGLVDVFERKDSNGKPISMDRVLEIIAIDLGKKLGSADLAMQLAHNALIAYRADEVLKNNAKIQTRADNLKSAASSLAKSNKPEDKKRAKELKSEAESMLKTMVSIRATKEEIDAGIEAMRKYPEIKEAYDVFTDYKNGLVDFLRDTGRINALTAKNWKENVGYVPWTRVEEEVNKFELDPRAFKNGVVNLSALPKLDKEGSSKEINNIFDNMVGLTYWAVRSGINNYAAQKTLNTLPNVEVIPEDQVSDVRKKHPDRVVFSYDGGERVAYLLADPLQLATFSTIAPIKGGLFSSMFAPAARFLRGTITHMPAFAISQLVQDGTYRAALLSGVKNPWKLPPKVFKNFYKALRKQKTGALGELERLGVSGIYDGMPEATAERLRQRLKLDHKNAFQKAWGALEDFSLAADLAVRAAIYEQTLSETGDRALAYYRAKEYINFKRQGTDPIIYELRQSIPFFNAYLQGMDVLYRTMTGKGVATGERKAAMKLFYVTGIQIAALNMLYAMMVGGDDEYEGLDDYVRNRNYIIPGTGIKIPVAPEVGFLFKVLPEQLYRSVFSEGVQSPQDATAVFKRLTSAFSDAFGGVEYLPQLVKPIIELSTNYSFFMESPIVGAGLKNVDPAMQFTESTSELAKGLGGMANISPVKLDYFIRAYTGMAGALVLDLTDSLANPDRMGKPLYKTPQVSTFMYDPTGRGYKSDFYKFREEIDKVADTVNMMKREGKAEELAEYLTEEKAVRFALRGMVNKVEQQLSNLRNYRKIIAADTTLSPEERRQMTRDILEQERDLVKAYDVKELRKIAGF